MLNPNGTRKFINRAGLKMLEASDFAEVASRPAWEFIAPCNQECAKAWLEKILSGEPGPSIELTLAGLDGVSRRVESHGVPLFDQVGRVEGGFDHYPRPKRTSPHPPGLC